jgi:hypothetical protein
MVDKVLHRFNFSLETCNIADKTCAYQTVLTRRVDGPRCWGGEAFPDRTRDKETGAQAGWFSATQLLGCAPMAFRLENG